MNNILSKEEFLKKENGNYKNEFWEIINELYGCDSETDIENRELTQEDFNNMYDYYIKRFNNEEKITLNGEQAERFIKEFCQGDIFGLKEIYKIVKEELKIKDTDMYYTIYDLIKDTIAMNNIYVWGCEDTNGLVEHYKEIYNLYEILKDKLFDSFTNNFEIYWE